jgi:hypothetical protein
MPRGIPKAGFRRTKNRLKAARSLTQPVLVNQNMKETDAEIEQKITERFGVLSALTSCAIAGEAKSLIVSGPPGLGKSYIVEETLAAWDPEELNHTIIKGFVKATGLYKMLYQYRSKGQVIVFDDADAIFFDDTALGMLKAVCDSTEKRRVSYLAEFAMVDEASGDLIPRQFTFNGTIIFISNIDFDAQIEKGNKLAPHLQAMMSRSHYIDLALKTRRDYLIRIRQVVKQGLLKSRGLNEAQEKDVLNFIDKNQDKLREFSLRIAIKISDLRKFSPNWEAMARVTTCRN